MNSELVLVSTKDLQDHPQNPRVSFNEEVIEGIAANLNGEWPKQHALIVRPIEGGYQIISGHHRRQAAERAGIDSVWCWVQDMDDGEAFMALATSNNQGELDPLEIGIHCYQAVENRWGKSGGGLKEYAKSIGKAPQTISDYRNAGRVTVKMDPPGRIHLLGKAKQLNEISKLPETCWDQAVEHVLEKQLSKDDTRDAVKRAMEGSTDKRVLALLLGKTSRRELERIDSLKDTFYDSLQSENLKEEWLEYFETDPLSLVKVKEVRDDLEERDAASDPPIVELCDAIEWLNRQEDCDLILTDPPYMTDVDNVAEFAESWLPLALSKMKDTGRAYICIGAYPEEITAYCSIAMPEQILIWTYRNTIGPSPKLGYKLNHQAILYYVGDNAEPLDSPVMMEQMSVQDISAPDGRHGNRFHEWQKPDELAERFISHSTQQGDLVLDPFACTGTFLLAAKKLGRIGIGCDISEENLKIAESRGCYVKK